MQLHTTLTRDYVGGGVLPCSESHLASVVLPHVAAVLTVGVLMKMVPRTGGARRQAVPAVSSLVLQV